MTPSRRIAGMVMRGSEWRCVIVGSFQDDAANAARIESFLAEVEDETDGDIEKFHVGQKLHAEAIEAARLHGLRLDEQSIVDEQVVTENLVDFEPFERDMDRLFTGSPMPRILQDLFETTDIDGLQKARSEMRMDPERGLDDFAGEGVCFVEERMHGLERLTRFGANAFCRPSRTGSGATGPARIGGRRIRAQDRVLRVLFGS